ncbi:MAG: hypothetical protein AAGJ86_06420 [Pseudomonadota bacterium]
MKPGALFFLIFIVAYMGFELYAVEKTRYRMEPEFIYLDHVRSEKAAALCNKDVSEWRERFAQNFAYAKGRAEAVVASSEATPAPDLAALTVAAKQDVARIIDEKGCKDTEVWRMLRRYELLAKRNPPIAPSTQTAQ